MLDVRDERVEAAAGVGQRHEGVDRIGIRSGSRARWLLEARGARERDGEEDREGAHQNGGGSSPGVRTGGRGGLVMGGFATGGFATGRFVTAGFVTGG
ncbi:MAG: hypothetical protein JNL83_32740, partial [Myxococcales bacterium]|nr:hypothetical protein [Myxococcales bacterium]